MSSLAPRQPESRLCAVTSARAAGEAFCRSGKVKVPSSNGLPHPCPAPRRRKTVGRRLSSTSEGSRHPQRGLNEVWHQRQQCEVMRLHFAPRTLIVEAVGATVARRQVHADPSPPPSW